MFRIGSRYYSVIAACVLMGTACFSLSGEQDGTPKAPVLPEGYRIGAGDILQVVVWKEPDASLPEAAVRSDGKITAPLVGEIDVVGLTPAQLKDALVEKFSHYINSPMVSVFVKEIKSRKVYVMGSVKKEGPLPLIGPLTILQAIDEAGGLGEWANRKKIYVLRRVDGKQVKLPFNYTAVIKGQHLDQNITLMPDDTIIVP